jgi:hypothetical protein
MQELPAEYNSKSLIYVYVRLFIFAYRDANNVYCC